MPQKTLKSRQGRGLSAGLVAFGWSAFSASAGGRCARRWLLLLTASWAATGAASGASAATPSEYELKAAFLFNFVRFIEWPNLGMPPASQPVVIGVLGDDPFNGALDKIVSGETINGRRLVVKRFQRKDDVTLCQVLYISRSEAGRLGGLLGRLKGKAVLTVSDIDRFAYVGGMIGLVMEQGRVRLQINLDTANAGRLAISAKLLRPALVIRNPPQSMVNPGWQRIFAGKEVAEGVHGQSAQVLKLAI
ncbi:MAG: putative transrane protein [Verrucomicrobia bacterium]|nr:putative transrane protein [Verrucomicrobiota bacterium]